MSSAAYLRRIVGAMTERPWHWNRRQECTGPERTVDYGVGPEVTADVIIQTDSGYYPPEDADREAIVALANHADALVGLVEAVEEVLSRESHGKAEDDLLEAALARVEAVK